jgi:hypothetical protein
MEGPGTDSFKSLVGARLDRVVIRVIYPFLPCLYYNAFPGTNNHAGNVKFRLMVNGPNKLRYLAASKADKPRVAADVVKLWRALNPPGRFLARKDNSRKGPGSVKVCPVRGTRYLFYLALEQRRESLTHSIGVCDHRIKQMYGTM